MAALVPNRAKQKKTSLRLRFDLALQMQGSGVYSTPFTLLLGAKTTAGFVRSGEAAGLLDAALPYPDQIHEIRCVLALTSFLGIATHGEELEFPLWPQEHAEATALLANVRPQLIGLHPAAREMSRR